jgi:hypothetical protein
LEFQLFFFETPVLNSFFNSQFNRQLKFDDNITVLCCHRTRDWTHQRKIVNELAQTKWKEIMDYVPSIKNRVFVETLSKYTFTLCVNGDGLDPSPKAFRGNYSGFYTNH